MKDTLYKRLAKAESAADYQNSEMMATIRQAYENACNDLDEESAAELARKIRNKLLEASDCKLALDRLGLSAPSGATFTAWLTFLRNLGSALSGSWAVYRQQLRDLPEQEGFPFNITFPEPPEE